MLPTTMTTTTKIKAQATQQFRLSLLVSIAAGLAMTGCKNEPGPGYASNIAAIVNAANAGEIQAGQLAQAQATSQDVKNFATRMVTEHSAMQQRQGALFARLGITPVEDATSRQLQDETRNMLAVLRTRSSSTFDLAYIEGQLAMHARLLDLLDNNLLPGAQRDELRADLQMMRGDVANHLQAARAVEAILLPSSDGGTVDAGRPDGGVSDGGTRDGGRADGGRLALRDSP